MRACTPPRRGRSAPSRPSTSTTGCSWARTGRSSPSATGRSRSPSCATAASPPEALRRYLEDLGLPRGDVHLDETRIRRLAVEAFGAAGRRAGSTGRRRCVACAPAPRRARPGRGSRAGATGHGAAAAVRCLAGDPRALPRAARLRGRARRGRRPCAGRLAPRERRRPQGASPALTGQERGPELWAVVLTLPRDEALSRAGAELRLHLLDGGEERADRPGRHAAVAPANRDELVARRLCGQRSRPDGAARPRAPRGCSSAGGGRRRAPPAPSSWRRRCCPAPSSPGPHAGVAEERVRQLRVVDVAVELDELLVSDLGRADARPLRERMVGMGDEHESVLVQRRGDDLRVTQRPTSPRSTCSRRTRSSTSSECDRVRTATRTRGWLTRNRRRMTGTRSTAPAPRLAWSRPAPPRSKAFTSCRPSARFSSARTA